ncbi:MAG: hypothetical protein H7A35_05955 [Planctomycetales bacterium]|nr:hypothetical protein [bacterium]UNM09602.1 MAG: hypothetical protein H7A35_05955 [Planctomycetales bacterium]
MAEAWYGRTWFRLAIMLLPVCLVALLAWGCPAGEGTGFGQNFMDVASTGHTTIDDYRYVADSSRQLYWPNTPKYRNRIRSENRVYILDHDTLKEFHGYKAGPK